MHVALALAGLLASAPAPALPFAATATTTQTSTPTRARGPLMPADARGRAGVPAPRTAAPVTSAAPDVRPGPFDGTMHLRVNVAAVGAIGTIPVDAKRSVSQTPRTTTEAGFEVALGFDAVEAIYAMTFSSRDATWRGDLDRDDEARGPEYRLKLGARVDLDGPADGLGWHLGLQAGLRLAARSLLREISNPNCADCAAVRDWRIESTATTIAFVPSLLWRTKLAGDKFRLDLDVEGAAWIGGRDETLSFDGDTTPEAVGAYRQIESGRRAGFYGAFVVRLGLRWGFAARIAIDRQPQIPKRTRRD